MHLQHRHFTILRIPSDDGCLWLKRATYISKIKTFFFLISVCQLVWELWKMNMNRMQSHDKRKCELKLVFCYLSFEMWPTQDHITITIGVLYSQTISTHHTLTVEYSWQMALNWWNWMTSSLKAREREREISETESQNMFTQNNLITNGTNSEASVFLFSKRGKQSVWGHMLSRWGAPHWEHKELGLQKGQVWKLIQYSHCVWAQLLSAGCNECRLAGC